MTSRILGTISLYNNWGGIDLREDSDYVIHRNHYFCNEDGEEDFEFDRECMFRKKDYYYGLERLEREGRCEIPVLQNKVVWDRNDSSRQAKKKMVLERRDGKIYLDGQETDWDINRIKIRRPDDSYLEGLIGRLLSAFDISELERSIIKMKLVDEFHLVQLASLSIDKRGFTGRGVIKFSDGAIKIDLAERLIREYYTYTELAKSEFKEFAPTLVDKSGFVEFEGIGFLPLTNLDYEPQGFLKSNIKFGQLILRNNLPFFSDNNLPYNLFLMGLFHKSAMLFRDYTKKNLGLVPYEDLDGNPHHRTMEDPGINNSVRSNKLFKESRIIGDSFIRIIDNYSIMLKEMHKKGKLVIIDGDWKPDNLYRGHKVDFACVGHSFEIDDLAYYLSDHSLGVGFEDFKSLLRSYAGYRCLHDPDFAGRSHSYNSSAEYLAASSWLRQLVLRHAVMKKRDLLDPEKFRQRQYYQHRINEVLKDKNSKFI